MKNQTLVKILILISAQFSLNSAHAADSNFVKIVSSLPRTGSSNSQTTSIVNGIKLAIEEAGAKAGNFEIKYDDLDDASPERGSWDPAVESANAEKAISDPDVMAYIGTYNSGAAKISMPKLNAAGLVMVSPGNSWPGLTKKGFGEASEPDVYRPSGKVTYFRVAVTDDLQGPAAASWAKELGAQRVFVLHDRELYGKGIADLFKKAAEAKGTTVVGYEGIDPKSSNYRSLATKIRQQKADLVFFGGTTQTNAGQLAKDLRASGLDVKLMVPDGCFEEAFITSAGAENLEGKTYITFGGVPPNKLTGAGQKFYENYKKRFGIEPESYSVYGYESAKVVISAIAKANVKDRLAIVKAVSETKDFDGALGKWSFDSNGDISVRILGGNTVKNGKFEFVKILSSS